MIELISALRKAPTGHILVALQAGQLTAIEDRIYALEWGAQDDQGLPLRAVARII